MQTENKTDLFLERLFDYYKNEIKELAKANKYAKIDLTIDMYDGKIDEKFNLTIKESIKI